eukprot:SAG22_NODE_13613_length_400_cov_1.076412_1_plen_37_part_10
MFGGLLHDDHARTQDGWVDVLYAAQDGVSSFVWPYFV